MVPVEPVPLVDSLSPMTEIALPPTVTGAVTGAVTCVPLPTASVPEVSGAVVLPPDAGAGAVVPLLPVLSLSPMTEIALPPTVTGAVTGAVTCVPLPTASVPEVSGAVVLPPDAGAGAVVPLLPVLSLSPMTEIALSPTVTGAVTGAVTCVPLATPSSPDVDGAVDPDVLPLEGAGAAASCPRVSLSPSTAIELPDTVMGLSLIHI